MDFYACVHTEKSFRIRIKLNRNQIVFTLFRLIWIQTEVRLDPNQLVNAIWIRVDLIRFRKDFSVCTHAQQPITMPINKNGSGMGMK